jgi:hypothetical protein
MTVRHISKLQLAQTSAESARENEQINKAERHPDRTQPQREAGKVQPDIEADSKSQRREYQIEKKLCAASLLQAEKVMPDDG